MYLIFDVGGAFIKYALLNHEGTIIEKHKSVTPKDGIDSFFNVISDIINQYKSKEIIACAMSCPGIIDSDEGVIYVGGAIPYLHEVNMIKEFNDRYHLKLIIENDGKAGALAELGFGALKGCQTGLVVALGTGVGGGIIINGKLHKGGQFIAGELSYMTSGFQNDEGKIDSLGIRCSAVRMVQRILHAKGFKGPLNGEEAFKYILQGDEVANGIFNEFCRDVSLMLFTLQYIIDPEVIAIGGGISAQPILIERIYEQLDIIKEANNAFLANHHIKTCYFMNDANIMGMYYLLRG